MTNWYVIEEWQWMALALTAITFAFTMRSLFLTWVSLAATVVGSIVWDDPTVPVLQQLAIFSAITLAGVAVSQFFIKRQPASTEDEELVAKAADASKIINRTVTLTEPIVDGVGRIEIDGVLWRLRGDDAEAGEQIRILGVDGLQLDVLIVTKEKLAKYYVQRSGLD